MFLDGQWYTIALGESATHLPMADRLDVNRLQEAVLAPLLGIGDVRTDNAEFDDFIIVKPNGDPVFHLAVVIDDGLMKISHVVLSV